jgi:hypothetical protein
MGILKYIPLADIRQAGDSVSSVTLNIKLALLVGLPDHQTEERFEARTIKPKNAFPCTGAELNEDIRVHYIVERLLGCCYIFIWVFL